MKEKEKQKQTHKENMILEKGLKIIFNDVGFSHFLFLLLSSFFCVPTSAVYVCIMWVVNSIRYSIFICAPYRQVYKYYIYMHIKFIFSTKILFIESVHQTLNQTIQHSIQSYRLKLSILCTIELY